MIHFRCWGVVFLLVPPLFLLAQNKVEREIRLKQEDVNKQARAYVDSFRFRKKVKWYREIGIDTTSLEAKVRYRGQRHSIEFSPDGQLQDIEVEIKKKELPAGVRQKIDAYLKQQFRKYAIDKVQVRHIGPPGRLRTYLLGRGSGEAIQVDYELVVSAKAKTAYKKYEILFSAPGDYLQSAEILQKNTDNLEY